MTKNNYKEHLQLKLNKLIYGNELDLSLEKKIFLMMNFVTLFIIVAGFISNLIIGLNEWSSISIVIAFFVIFYINYQTKKIANYQKYIKVMFFVSIILLSLAWFTNGGYNSNITLLIFVYFLALYTIIQDKLKIKVFISYLLMFIILVCVQYQFPNSVIGYENEYQRIVDIVFGGSLYFIFIYFIMKIVVDNYKFENKTIDNINKELKIKNLEILENTQQLRESEEKYKNLFNTMPNGFYKSTPEGYFVDANPAFINMLGYDTLEELKYIYIPNTLYVEESDRTDIMEHLSEFNSQVEIYRLKKKDGSIIWIEESPRYIKDENNNILFHEGICKDITQRLESEIELNASRRELLELNATKDKFFSIIAHDLKNPLGSFKELIRIMVDEYDTFDEVERKEILEIVKNSSSQVYNLLENLLQWSMSQRGLINCNPILLNLKNVIETTVEVFNINLSKKNINIDLHINNTTFVLADNFLLTTIVRNLISNSIKFTNQNDNIEIGILNHEDLTQSVTSNLNISNNQVIFYIKDNGVGIPKEYLNEIFLVEKHITTAGTMGEKGTGLGLVLVNEFVEKNGGNLWVESTIGVGTTVYFTITKSSESL